MRTNADRATLRAFWQVTAIAATLVALAVLAHWRPDLVASALTYIAGFAVLLAGIGFGEAWKVWRGVWRR